jgi:hypothetical protein
MRKVIVVALAAASLISGIAAATANPVGDQPKLIKSSVGEEIPQTGSAGGRR